jgi:hypothetical protein
MNGGRGAPALMFAIPLLGNVILGSEMVVLIGDRRLHIREGKEELFLRGHEGKSGSWSFILRYPFIF